MRHNFHAKEAKIDTDAGLYYKEAQALFLPVTPRPEINGFELKISNQHYLFYVNDTPFNTSSSAFVAMNKYSTNQILATADIPVPKGVLFHSSDLQSEPLENIITDLRFPLVIKPVDGSLGLGVLCNIKTINELSLYLEQYSASYPRMIIEEYYGGLQSYRVLVFNRRVIGVVLCLSARVLGDGKHTIQELIALTNIKRKETNDKLGPIVFDDECQIRLKELGIDKRYIPALGEVIVLGYTSNPLRGGSYEALGVKICKENRKLMIKVAKTLNLGLAGIDLECTDINTPISQSQGVILDVNHRPSMSIHELPITGKPQAVTKKIMRSFIFRHPFSYLYILYSNKRTRFYLRAMILALVAISVFLFVY
ncbi:Cyanophycin synthetase [Legionella massiliensis]|uniref:Cyanophycin synthetase n=1 Tax=Legionella massiliensis TaxID=1034943 RepID=A0A078L4K0_9GAMM|nr:UDP-N-acetylmuramyl peptide synthase [Legionella massiliensis]CDZ78848.1 Cyanophycin synthetase [Legionella massiliensis]CEE14586.1 Cyanophycin synthetase [Legionella massiliensis]